MFKLVLEVLVLFFTSITLIGLILCCIVERKGPIEVIKEILEETH